MFINMFQLKSNFGLCFNFSLEKNKALRGLNILNLKLKPLGKVLFSLYLYGVLSFNTNNSCDLNNKVHNLLHIGSSYIKSFLFKSQELINCVLLSRYHLRLIQKLIRKTTYCYIYFLHQRKLFSFV